MRIFILIYALCIIVHNEYYAQSALITNLPKVKVDVRPIRRVFSEFGSVRFLMTITNTADTMQHLLIRKVHSTYPWGTFATIINEHSKDTASQLMNHEMLSSEIYTEGKLKKSGAFETLQPGASISQSYYLANVAILKEYKQSLKPGKYKCFISYYGNASNEFEFTIERGCSHRQKNSWPPEVFLLLLIIYL